MRSCLVFFANLAGLNAVIAIAGILAWFFSWWAAIAASIVLSLAFSVIGIIRREPLFHLTTLAAMFGGILTAQPLPAVRAIASGPEMEVSSVDAIADHPEVMAFTLQNALVRTDLEGWAKSENRRSSHSRIRYTYAAPLVDEGWTADAPVRVWVVCGELAQCRKAWQRPPGAAIRLVSGQQDEDECRDAAMNAADRHGLKMLPSPLFVQWAESVAAYRDEALADVRFAVVFWNLAWFVPWLVWKIVALFRRR